MSGSLFRGNIYAFSSFVIEEMVLLKLSCLTALLFQAARGILYILLKSTQKEG